MKQALVMYLKVSFLNDGKYSSIKIKQNPINNDEFISSVPLAIQYKTSSVLHSVVITKTTKIRMNIPSALQSAEEIFIPIFVLYKKSSAHPMAPKTF